MPRITSSQSMADDDTKLRTKALMVLARMIAKDIRRKLATKPRPPEPMPRQPKPLPADNTRPEGNKAAG